MDISTQHIGLVTLAGPDGRPAPAAIVQDHYDIDGPWHHHDMHQIQYAFEGSIALEDMQGRHLLPRSLAGWIPAGVTHRDSLHRVRSVSLLLDPELVPEAGDRVRVLRVSPLMREMIAEAARWPLDRPQDETGRHFFTAFACLCRDWIADEAPFNLPTSTDRALEAATAYTRANLTQSSFPAVCRAAGLSQRTLRRRFQAELGMGWEHYRRRARLLAAAEALTTSNCSIAQVAAGSRARAPSPRRSRNSRAKRRALSGRAPPDADGTQGRSSESVAMLHASKCRGCDRQPREPDARVAKMTARRLRSGTADSARLSIVPRPDRRRRGRRRRVLRHVG